MKTWQYILLGLATIVFLIGIGYLLGVAYPFKKEIEREYVIYLKDYRTEITNNEREKLQINNNFSNDTTFISKYFPLLPDSSKLQYLMEQSRQLHIWNDTTR